MEDPMIYIVVVVALGYAAWLGIKTIHHNQDIATLKTTSGEVNSKLNYLVKSFEGLENKFDLFLKSELDTLKKLSEASTSAMEKIASKK